MQLRGRLTAIDFKQCWAKISFNDGNELERLKIKWKPEADSLSKLAYKAIQVNRAVDVEIDEDCFIISLQLHTFFGEEKP